MSLVMSMGCRTRLVTCSAYPLDVQVERESADGIEMSVVRDGLKVFGVRWYSPDTWHLTDKNGDALILCHDDDDIRAAIFHRATREMSK